MRITVILTGALQAIAHTRRVELDLAEKSTFTAVVCALAARYPDLVGVLVDSDGCTLLSSNLISVNEKEIIMPGMMDGRPVDGDQLTIFSPITGG